MRERAERHETPQLRERASRASKDGRVLVLACGAIARELLAISAINGWDHFDVRALPAELHNRPERICDALRSRIRRARPLYGDRILIGYADCGTGGGLDRLCAEEGVTRLPGAHCYAFYSGIEAFTAREEEDVTSFFLTDFLVDHFDNLVIRGLGLDRHPELRDMYFSHYRKVVFLAQTDPGPRRGPAAAAAKALGLELEIRWTGYGEVADFLRTGADRTEIPGN